MKTRSTHQRGWVESRKRKNGKRVFVIRWHERDPDSAGGWRKASRTLAGCRSKKAAQRELDRQMQQVNRINSAEAGGTVGRQRLMTFREFVEGMWVEYQESRDLKPSTRYGYESIVNTHLLPQFGEQALEEITPRCLSALFARLRRQGLSAQSLRNVYALLNVMFEIAVESDLVETSPVRRKLHRPKVKKVEKPVLTPEQFQRLYFCLPDRWKPLFVCAAVTGLRAGELLALRWKSLDLVRGRLEVVRSVWRGRLSDPKTAASRRTLQLPEALTEMLLEHRSNSSYTAPEDLIFCREDGTPCDPNYLRKFVLYPAMDAAKIRRGRGTHGFHLFRHTVASIIHERTGSLKNAQTFLGHSQLSTTANIYVHVDEAQSRRIAETVSSTILPSCPLFAQQKGEEEETVQ